MSLEINATIDLLRDYVSRAQIAIKALEELEGKGIIPAGTVVAPTKPDKPTKPKPAAIAKRIGRPPKAAVAEAGTKTCSKCGKTMPVPEFTCGGKGSRCKACIREYQNAWAAKRRESKGGASGPLPYACEECHAKFSSKAALETHMEVKHGDEA